MQENQTLLLLTGQFYEAFKQSEELLKVLCDTSAVLNSNSKMGDLTQAVEDVEEAMSSVYTSKKRIGEALTSVMNAFALIELKQND